MATTLKVRLLHRSSVPHARWCEPVGWEPGNEIEGAEFLDGSWWSDHEEEAGLLLLGAGRRWRRNRSVGGRPTSR